MAKRFTDTHLYDKAWFRVLPPRLKCAWEWLCKRCDIIGVWNIDMGRLSFEVGEAVSLEELKEHFGVQVFDDDKIFIPSFVTFQYGDLSGKLTEGHKFHDSVISQLKLRNLPIPETKPNPKKALANNHPNDTHSIPYRKGQGKGEGIGIGIGYNNHNTPDPLGYLKPENQPYLDLLEKFRLHKQFQKSVDSIREIYPKPEEFRDQLNHWINAKSLEAHSVESLNTRQYLGAALNKTLGLR